MRRLVALVLALSLVGSIPLLAQKPKKQKENSQENHGCLPPGQAKKRYVVGHSLPHGIVVGELPVELSVRIGPAPGGYRYGIIDGDVVKLAVGTMLVVDAI